MSARVRRSDDPRLTALRESFAAGADLEHAEFHAAYHKSSLRFYGLRTDAMRRAVNEAFPKREVLTTAAVRALARELWASRWFEERVAALLLLERVAELLVLGDLGWLSEFANESEGWALCDRLASKVLAPLALAVGADAWAAIAHWAGDSSLWVRRASVVVHVVPGRSGRLFDESAWPTFERLLGDGDFFIRKALGWALREIAKKRPEDVAEFAARIAERAAPLTLREATRNLPARLRASASARARQS